MNSARVLTRVFKCGVGTISFSMVKCRQRFTFQSLDGHIAVSLGKILHGTLPCLVVMSFVVTPKQV